MRRHLHLLQVQALARAASAGVSNPQITVSKLLGDCFGEDHPLAMTVLVDSTRNDIPETPRHYGPGLSLLRHQILPPRIGPDDQVDLLLARATLDLLLTRDSLDHIDEGLVVH